MLAYLTSINVVLLVFNLIPAFPLDGGRIARAIVWKVTGDRTQATRFAALLGQGFSYILIGLGIAVLVGVRVPLVGSTSSAAVADLHRHVPRAGGAHGATYQTALLSKHRGRSRSPT